MRLEGRRFVRRNVFLRPIPRASERAMASGRGGTGKETTGRGWESDPECFSRSKRAFSFRRSASGSGFVRFPAISWVSSSRGGRCRGKPWGMARTHRSFAQFYPGGGGGRRKFPMRKLGTQIGTPDTVRTIAISITEISLAARNAAFSRTITHRDLFARSKK